MKFMKLGSKPDMFQSDGNNIRFVSSELATDVIIIVDEAKFYLHKFPLLSKSYRLQRMILEANCEGTDKVNMNDFPGGPQAFEICVKFCYGITVTLSAYNVVAARCAAEYLEMTEDVEKGNLIYKIEVFLNSSVFRSWRDSIIVLQTTISLLPWSEELKIEGRCIDSIASKSSLDPSSVHWSYTYNNKPIISDKITEIQQKNSVPKDWWIEDICELDVDLYKRTMMAIKSRGRMSSDLIIEALKAYVMRWLPDSCDILVSDDCTRRNKYLVETIIWLLPSDKASVCSCRFLLKLLKVVILVDSGSFLKEELMNRISTQLDKASVKDLLISSRSSGETPYDLPLVQSLVKRFMILERSAGDTDYTECENRAGLILGHASLLSVGKLVDGYLAEIGSDPKLQISNFIDLVQSLPDAAARPTHDGLYTAIDVFLKAHPDLPKAERKRICSLLDLKKLTPGASIHAAQNDRLPLRVVVQVLFFEQMRAASTAGTLKAATGSILNGSTRLTGEVEEEWEAPASEHCKSLEKQLRFLKVEEDGRLRREIKNENEKDNKSRLLPSRSRRILDKFWAGKVQAGQNNRSSETSGSSQSPPTSANPVEASTTKSSGSSSRHRRHSVS